MENNQIHSSKAPRGALEKKCARKAVDFPAAKRTKHTEEENTENHGAGVSVCVPPTKSTKYRARTLNAGQRW